MEPTTPSRAKSPLPLILGGCIGLLVLVLLIERAGLPQLIADWVARLW